MLFVAVFSYGQFQIAGNVANSTNEDLVGCHIHIGSKIAISDNLGNFQFSNIEVGRKRLYATFIGYKTFDTIIYVQKDQTFNLKLSKSINDLREIVIKQQVNSENSSVLEQKIKAETIEKYASQTLGDALKEIAGVSVLKTGNSIVKPIINGLSSGRVPIISNNVRLEDQQWGAEHAPNFDINAAGKITILKGASALQYGGDAIGGLVLVEPISIKKDTLFGKTIMNYNTNGQGGTISSSLHKGNFCDWSWNALGTFKYSGDRNAAEYVLSNTGNREINFSGDVKYIGKRFDITAFYSLYNAKIGILKASHIGNVNDLYQSISNQIPFIINAFTYNLQNPKQNVQHHLGKINFDYRLSDAENIIAQYAFQFNHRQEFDVRRGNLNNLAALDLELVTHSFNVDYKKNGIDWNFKSGISATYQTNFANPATGIRPLIPTYEKIDAGIYGVLSRQFENSLTVDAGLRYDFSNINASKYYIKTRWTARGYDPEFNSFIINSNGNQWFTKPSFTFHNLAASIGLHKVIENDIEIYANASLSMRNPNPSELFSDGLHHSTGVIEIGDLRLMQEKSFKAAVTFQKKWEAVSLTLNPFINRIQNFMFLRPIGFESTIRGAYPVWEYQQTTAFLTGIDFQSVWKINNNWQHTAVFALVNGHNLSENVYLIDMPPINFSNKMQFQKASWNHFSIDVKNEVVLQQKRFPNYDFNTNILVNGSLQEVVVPISQPPPAYQLWSCSAQMDFKTFKKTNMTIMLSGQNIFGIKYRDYLNRQRLFADELGRNIQLQIKINY